MQNPNVKYLKMSNGYFCLFYRENNILFLRTNTGTDWSSPQILAERTSTPFSVCQFKDVCYVLYSSMEGNLYLASSIDFVNWEHKPLMGGATNSSRTKFFMVPTEDALHMIYPLPTETKGIESLVYTVLRNGRWENPTQIDRFIPFGKASFFARRLSKDHIILYYRISRNTWSAREMLLSPYTLGSLSPLVQAPTNFIDISIVNDMERIHTLYIIRNMFRTQILYQYKQTTAISTPRVLWEDTNCDNALALLENNKVVLMWTVNGRPLRCISDNNGATFGAVERYTGNFPTQCMKGELISAESLEYNAMETYGDVSSDYNPFLIINASGTRPKLQSLPFEKEMRPLAAKQEKSSPPIYFTQDPQPHQNRLTQEIPSQRIAFVQEPRPSQVAQESQPQPISYEQETLFGGFAQESQSQPTPFFQEAQSGLFAQEPVSQRTSYGQETQFGHIPQEASPKRVSYEQKTHYDGFLQEPNPQLISNGQEAQQKLQKKTTSRQNSQKQQLEELTALLAQRSDEITEVNARWKTQISRLESELDVLRKENETLKQSLKAHLAKKQRSASVQHVHLPNTEEAFQKLQAAENISLPLLENQQPTSDSVNQADQKAEPEE